ncbi:MAG: hypothetical protein HQK53_14895 [Oligoflexia bacterium]|nr:hypothetical protein [Oligoflexia bacterium]
MIFIKLFYVFRQERPHVNWSEEFFEVNVEKFSKEMSLVLLQEVKSAHTVVLA